jgi:hypothetical protein
MMAAHTRAKDMTAAYKNRFLRGIKPGIAAFAVCAALTGGCAALPVALPFALPLVVSGAGGGVAYTVTNVAYKTFSHPITDVEDATHGALKKMAIEELSIEGTEDGLRITSFTRKLNI